MIRMKQKLTIRTALGNFTKHTPVVYSPSTLYAPEVYMDTNPISLNTNFNDLFDLMEVDRMTTRPSTTTAFLEVTASHLTDYGYLYADLTNTFPHTIETAVVMAMHIMATGCVKGEAYDFGNFFRNGLSYSILEASLKVLGDFWRRPYEIDGTSITIY